MKLPGNPKLGEGKPENQNHAIVFTRGNAVQTIDMNQVANLTVYMDKYSILFPNMHVTLSCIDFIHFYFEDFPNLCYILL